MRIAHRQLDAASARSSRRRVSSLSAQQDGEAGSRTRTKGGSRASRASWGRSHRRTTRTASRSQRASSSPGPGCREASATDVESVQQPHRPRGRSHDVVSAVSGLSGVDRAPGRTLLHSRVRHRRQQGLVALQRLGPQETRVGAVSRHALSRLPEPHVLTGPGSPRSKRTARTMRFAGCRSKGPGSGSSRRHLVSARVADGWVSTSDKGTTTRLSISRSGSYRRRFPARSISRSSSPTARGSCTTLEATPGSRRTGR